MREITNPNPAELIDRLRHRQYDALLQRISALETPTPWITLCHAAALLGIGQLEDGLQLAKGQLSLDLSPLTQTEALKIVGLVLQREGHPELARSWLEQAAGLAPHDKEVGDAIARCRPPAFLAPEKYAPAQGRTLKRHAPRESSNYVYTIDIVGTCNLRCPTCPVGNMPMGHRTRGFMALEMFESILGKIADECPDKNPNIWLFNWGEPLLHPQLPGFIEAANRLGMPTYLSSNLNIKRGIDALIATNPTDLKISLSGISDETYAQTHERGKIDVVIANMRKIRQSLDRHGVGTHVWVGHHIYRHNQHELESMAGLCRELGFGHHPIPAFFQPLEKLVQIAEGETLQEPVLDLLIEHPADYINRFRDVRDERFDCELRFNQTIINHDGSVALCCSVYSSENQLGVQFLDLDHESLTERKYAHSFCETCYQHGLQYAPRKVHNVRPSTRPA